MPGLVPGIQPTACSAARFALDPGNKCRDDTELLELANAKAGTRQR
jgi:hypothetical protein